MNKSKLILRSRPYSIRVGFAVTLALFATSPQAQLEENEPASARLQDAFSEVIVNHTITPQGREFYRAFVMGMNDEEQQPVHFSSISVEERPHSRSGSLISVESAQGQIVQVPVSIGATGQVELLGKRVAAYVHQKLLERELNAVFTDPDLGVGDLN